MSNLKSEVRIPIDVFEDYAEPIQDDETQAPIHEPTNPRQRNVKPRGPRPVKLKFTPEDVAAIEKAISDRAYAVGGSGWTPRERALFLVAFCKESAQRTDEIWLERRKLNEGNE